MSEVRGYITVKMRNELIPMYRELYHIYYMLNRVCWSGTLPYCALVVSQKQRRSWAYATPICAAGGPLISINSSACSLINTDIFIGIMAHEMTHIWQFSRRHRGGHGKDFKNEMGRIGLDYKNQCLYEDGPLVFTIKLHRMRNFNVTACFSTLRRGDFNRQDQLDFYLANRRELFQ